MEITIVRNEVLLFKSIKGTFEITTFLDGPRIYTWVINPFWDMSNNAYL